MAGRMPKRRAPCVSSARRAWSGLGIRMALAARRGGILRLIVRCSRCWLLLRRASPGALSEGAPVLNRGSRGGGLFAVSVAALNGAGVLAGFLPARRATKGDPLVEPRYEQSSCLRVDEGQTGDRRATPRRKELAGHLHPWGRESCSDQRRPNESVALGASQHGLARRARW